MNINILFCCSADEDRLTIVEDDANSDGNLVKGKPKQSSKRIKRQRFLIDSESDSEKENVSNDQKRKHESGELYSTIIS